jgi:hypothetical protein
MIVAISCVRKVHQTCCQELLIFFRATPTSSIVVLSLLLEAGGFRLNSLPWVDSPLWREGWSGKVYWSVPTSGDWCPQMPPPSSCAVHGEGAVGEAHSFRSGGGTTTYSPFELCRAMGGSCGEAHRLPEEGAGQLPTHLLEKRIVYLLSMVYSL